MAAKVLRLGDIWDSAGGVSVLLGVLGCGPSQSGTVSRAGAVRQIRPGLAG